MNTLTLALRNLLRNRRRSLATLLAMTVGATSILLFGGYVRNIVYGLQTGYVRTGGHLQLQQRDYFRYGSADPLAYGIADYQSIIEQVKRDPVLAPMLTVVTPTLQFGGIAGNFSAGVSRTALASGVVVADQNALRRWNEYGFPGDSESLALTGTDVDSAVIGIGVARVLRLCARLHVSDCPAPHTTAPSAGHDLPNDVGLLVAREKPAEAEDEPRLELLAATTGGAPNVAGFKVVRAEAQGIKEFDDVYVGVHLSEAQRLLYGKRAPEATAIVLQLHRTEQIPAAIARLQYLLATSLHDRPLAVYDFRTLNPYYGQALGLFGAIFGFMALLIGAIVLFTVGNTMSTAVVERTVEIGTLRAIGARRAGIRRLFVSEGLLLGILGATCGVASALALASLINHSGIAWTPPGRATPVQLYLRVWGENRLLIGTAIGLISVAVLSALWPARRAARLQIVEALRHV